MADEIKAEKWSVKFINDLPDAAFAYIKPGGKKDEGGKTKPRGLRYLPHHNQSVKSPTEDSSVDKPHLRNALARLPQSNLSTAAKAKAKAHLLAHAKALKIGEGESSILDDEEIITALDQIGDEIKNYKAYLISRINKFFKEV